MMEPPHFPLPRDRSELPSDAVMQGLMDELDGMLKRLPETQEKLMSLTGVAWSPDGLVKAEVGPRGQLTDLEIDPRVFRNPDSHGLRDSIMAAVTSAVRQVGEQTQELLFGQVPEEYAELRAQFRPAGDDPIAQMLRTDADLTADRGRKDA